MGRTSQNLTEPLNMRLSVACRQALEFQAKCDGVKTSTCARRIIERSLGIASSVVVGDQPAVLPSVEAPKPKSPRKPRKTRRK